MKKASILFLSFAFVFALAGVTHADTTEVAVPCSFPDHAIYNSDNSVIVGCLSNANYAKAQADAAARNDLKLPTLIPGQVTTDEGGIALVCPAYFVHSCVDISHTDGYRAAMRGIVSDLASKGWMSQFPSLQGWVGR